MTNTNSRFLHGKGKVHAAFYPSQDEYHELRVHVARNDMSLSEYVLRLVRADQKKRERKAGK